MPLIDITCGPTVTDGTRTRLAEAIHDAVRHVIEDEQTAGVYLTFTVAAWDQSDSEASGR
ncbi:hypothetical protein ABQE45_07080 [Mycobacteroides chelonae]